MDNIKINCRTEQTARLHDLVPFQGELKRRTPKDIEELQQSLLNEGMMMPFAVWNKEGKQYLLDGHGRLEALIRLSMKMPTVLDQEFPVIAVQADTEEDARKALLQITSSYGHISKKGVVTFTQTIPEYKAPIINKVIGVRHRKLKDIKPVTDTNTRITLSIPTDKVKEVLDILKTVPFIAVL